MYTFTFRISEDKKTFEKVYSEITIQAPGYYDEATITKTDDYFWWLKLVSRFWPLASVPPCGMGFDFDGRFSPWQLYYAVKKDDLYFEVETDYPGDLTKAPLLESDETEVEVGGIDEETGSRIIYAKYKNPYILY